MDELLKMTKSLVVLAFLLCSWLFYSAFGRAEDFPLDETLKFQ